MVYKTIRFPEIKSDAEEIDLIQRPLTDYQRAHPDELISIPSGRESLHIFHLEDSTAVYDFNAKHPEITIHSNHVMPLNRAISKLDEILGFIRTEIDSSGVPEVSYVKRQQVPFEL